MRRRRAERKALGEADLEILKAVTADRRAETDYRRLAREQGAKVISITGEMHTALVDYSDVVINVETLENTELFTPTTSRIAALVTVDILSTLVARRLGRAHNQRLIRMKRYLSQMRKNGMF